jgi:hypothetical protein
MKPKIVANGFFAAESFPQIFGGNILKAALAANFGLS